MKVWFLQNIKLVSQSYEQNVDTVCLTCLFNMIRDTLSKNKCRHSCHLCFPYFPSQQQAPVPVGFPMSHIQSRPMKLLLTWCFIIQTHFPFSKISSPTPFITISIFTCDKGISHNSSHVAKKTKFCVSYKLTAVTTEYRQMSTNNYNHSVHIPLAVITLILFFCLRLCIP